MVGQFRMWHWNFEDKLIGVVQDKCIASVELQVSPTFWGWLFQFGRRMRILSPEKLMEEYHSKIEELAD